MEKFEDFTKEKENDFLIYKEALHNFLSDNKMAEKAVSEKDKYFSYSEGEKTLDELDLDNPEYLSHEKPVSIEAASKLETPVFISEYFKSKNCQVVPPISIINKQGTTLFTSAGIQILDNVIHNEEEIPKGKLFVAQPVFRTQFINKAEQGISTSFINISTEIVNPTQEQHFNTFTEWLRFLESLGFNRSKLIFSFKDSRPKWGDKKFKSHVIKVHYDGLEIGDAGWIYDFPQETRSNLRISDIGFGLERIKWLLNRGNYFSPSDAEEEKIKGINSSILDYCKTLSLLAGSNLKPSNKEQGYRFRQLSKRLISVNTKEHEELNPLLEMYYKFWHKWSDISVSKEVALETINIENERNFNRELLNRLKEKFLDTDININQPTKELIRALRGTSVEKNFLNKVLEQMYGK